MRPHSGIPKKVREANLRRQRSKDRKFNEPLRIFLERRHPNILIEFGQLYDWLDQQNPNRKSLIITDALWWDETTLLNGVIIYEPNMIFHIDFDQIYKSWPVL